MLQKHGLKVFPLSKSSQVEIQNGEKFVFNKVKRSAAYSQKDIIS